jgi:hypothetical protein
MSIDRYRANWQSGKFLNQSPIGTKLPNKIVITFVALFMISGCKLNYDLSDHPIDGKLSLCLLKYGVDNMIMITHIHAKTCILTEIYKKDTIERDIKKTVVSMGFVCNSESYNKCYLNSVQRLYAIDFRKYTEDISKITLQISDDLIGAIAIEQQTTGSDGVTLGPFKTDSRLPSQYGVPK